MKSIDFFHGSREIIELGEVILCWSTTSQEHAQRVWRLILVHFMPWHYVKVSGQLCALPTLSLRKVVPVPIGCEGGWVQELVWIRLWRRNVSVLVRNETLAIHSISSHLTDWGVLAPKIELCDL